jgi:hypothetical protein
VPRFRRSSIVVNLSLQIAPPPRSHILHTRKVHTKCLRVWNSPHAELPELQGWHVFTNTWLFRVQFQAFIDLTKHSDGKDMTERFRKQTSLSAQLPFWTNKKTIRFHLVTKKRKQSHYTPESAWAERRYSSYSFSTSALNGGGWSASRPGRALAPGKGPPVPTGKEAGWAPQPVWTQRLEEKSFRLCRGSNLDRPVVQPVATHYTDWATWITHLVTRRPDFLTRQFNTRQVRWTIKNFNPPHLQVLRSKRTARKNNPE